MQNLDYFFKSLLSIKGVGDKFYSSLIRLLGVGRFKDIMFHFPGDIIDRTKIVEIKDIEIGKINTLKLEVVNHIKPPFVRGRKIPYKIVCSDDTGIINLTFFNAADYLKNQFPVGKKISVSGKVDFFAGEFVISHPDYMVPVQDIEKIAVLEPIYPLTYAVTNKMVRNVVSEVLKNIPDVGEWQNDADISFAEAIKILHNPIQNKNFMDDVKRRLAYDEILANQLALALSREEFKREKGVKIKKVSELVEKLKQSFGYELTNAQNRVLEEITDDLKSDYRMLRLLQGDVGSGKTIIAILALMMIVEEGFQGAFMVPTEILAKQHQISLTKLLENADIDLNVMILTGKDKGKARQEKLEKIKNGDVDIIIGTHALFQEGVDFYKLGLVVIDEQHKFGVKQRLSLVNKAKDLKSNVLMMTATPIPRTLAMVSFGDMDLSIIDEMPPNRKIVETSILSQAKIDELVNSVYQKIKNNEIKKLYWVCPLVEESEKLDVSDVMSRYEHLKSVFGDMVGLVHGKMKQDEKDKVMSEFVNPNGKIKILIATTVIEVGVNVPEATLMIIEHSERFGLSSLHQLRGRIGRGDDKSYCILMHSLKLTKIARERLSIMKETTDGFKIAEKDLKLRGCGDVLGVRQSGIVDFKIADFEEDYDLFMAAGMDVKNILKNDKINNTNRWKSLQNLLYIFEYTEKLSSFTS